MNILMEDIPYGLCAMVEIVGMDKFVEICKLYDAALYTYQYTTKLL